jgi:ABC-2 type transport system ATP-binding protein
MSAVRAAEPIVSVTDLSKRYGPVVAVDRVTFTVARGEIFGILGPNGAGKTTTLETLEGLRRPDGGQAVVGGVDVRRDPRGVRARIGVQLQEAGFFERLTVAETLELFGSFHRTRLPVDDVIARLQLQEKRGAAVGTLSGGQRQRLSVATALINDPPLIFLDEPTTGLDPQARRNLWDVIAGMRAEGRTVILTTHYMEEAQRLCDRVAIMDHGRIAAMDSPRELIRRHTPGTTVALTVLEGSAAYAGLPGVQRAEAANGDVVMTTTDPMQTVNALMELAREGQVQFQRLRVEEATLEDVFLQLTGRLLRE